MKANANAILEIWINSETEYWSELRDLEKKLLIERIVQRKRIPELAKMYDKPIRKMQVVLAFLMVRIKTHVSEELAKLLSDIEEEIDLPDYHKIRYSPN
jgi:hypothetical protein